MRRRVVVTLALGNGQSSNGHEATSRAEMARRLARVTGFDFAGEYDPRRRYGHRPYFVPGDTLTHAAAASLNIGDSRDLFGGVVPAAFVATKTITHPLVDEAASVPPGWSREFPRRVAESVLAGYSAFARNDAIRAGHRLLNRGPVRVKLGTGVAGVGQWVARDATELKQGLEAIPDDVIAESGLVLEENLDDVRTHSVGRVRTAGVTASYCGEQRQTTNNQGAEVYGGSELRVVRGGYDALLALRLSAKLRLAIAQARVYDRAADECFLGFFASRRNYDVAQGIDAQGRWRSGVLEQSWRLGGASGAEIAAIEAFCADPKVNAVRAVSREVYGDCPSPPDDAAVYFRGVDPNLGPLTKYARVECDAHAR